ncbi:hypothetical protein TOPH_01820 [Tolypocladium ophioglossoides CBS 100239]|uniref:Uncharacterized protein n=1 Tax=Tolypocladium ophioglossoides (strain CBS 100239) TaxID=1163406 RepID=A0A0L0NIK9_TOLOC|nr:hypothetical protein TOPH_01820 [Tolypocladium ophioglossoides CBS 100239]
MEDSLNIQNLLQTGYFTTSRPKNPYSFVADTSLPARTSTQPQTPALSPRVRTANKHVPRSLDRRSPSRRSYPPPPSVEDEVVSLAKEYGTSRTSSAADEEPRSRGDIEQYPIIMEVHEHNPERRFVILNEPPDASSEAMTAESKFQGTPTLEDSSSSKTDTSRKYESGSGKEQPRSDSAKPSLQRRRSRQDLHPLETDLRPNRPPEHHRSRSSASASRPDYFSAHQSRPYGDQLLSPEVIHSGLGGKEKAYHGLGPSFAGGRSPTRQSHVETTDRRRDDEYYKRRQTGSTARRSESSYEAGKSSRRMSNEWPGESRNRMDPSSSRSERRDNSQSYVRSNGEKVKTSPPRVSREQSRSNGEYTKDSNTYSYTEKKPIVVQEGRPSAASSDRDINGTGKARSRSRMSTAPLASPSQAAFATAAAGAAAMTPRTSATVPVPGERKRPDGPRAQLPYPDDDGHAYIGLGIADSDVALDEVAPRSIPIVSMPQPLPVLPSTPEPPPDTINATSPTVTPTATPGSWQLPSFNLERDGLRVDGARPVGSYRRYSESKDKDGPEGLPECPRTKPVAGMMDWLTLPRTDFNICPTCYEAVFVKSEFRTQFQPMLRPTGEPIACDFGSSPWYRIAWLLTEKHETPDLRLFYQIANVVTSSRNETCPGNRKAARNWLTVKDPYTKRPVPEFAVCYECARTVEVLLPNLTGAFVPLESRPEPTKDICALHFTPKRKQFVLYFDALETTSDKAFVANKAPNIADLARDLQQLSIGSSCREDSPVHDGYWHVMQFLPQFTVCGACFDEVVRPKLGDGNTIVRNFYMDPQRLPSGTCQLYSPRMREIFQKACRRRDPGYLKEKALERRNIEADIFDKLLKLDRAQRSDAWTEEQVEKLVREWRRWE